jgi:hypothetical protein
MDIFGYSDNRLTVTQAATNDNYVTVEAPDASAGNYVLTVVEMHLLLMVVVQVHR